MGEYKGQYKKQCMVQCIVQIMPPRTDYQGLRQSRFFFVFFFGSDAAMQETAGILAPVQASRLVMPSVWLAR